MGKTAVKIHLVAGANLAGATFEDAIIGLFDTRELCKNPSLDDEVKFLQVGCRD